jgi:quercetin dioxygenase-like cupin family protein
MRTPSRTQLALVTAGVTIAMAAAGASSGALATAPNGETATPLARGTIGGPANVNRKVGDGRVRIKTSGALDALVVEITLAPGGTGGWHAHAGPLVTIVKQGTLTLLDSRCMPHEIGAGHAAILSGSMTKDENRGTTPVTFDVTFLIPHDAASPRIDEPAPSGCTA